METVLPKPVLKWVGGKRQLLPELLKHIPGSFNAYHEPFVGGGALFFELSRLGQIGSKGVFLSDVNPELINFYWALRHQFDQLLFGLQELKAHHTSEADFYSFRRDYNKYNDIGRAALFLYFNKTAFNGLMRQNRSGQWNMPWGKYSNPTICDESVLQAAKQALEGASILCQGFVQAMKRANKGDLVYCDPPYIPVSDTAKFVNYSKDGFTPADQEHLASEAISLVQRGVTVIVSNADTPRARELYKDFELHAVQARRAINCQADKRGPVGELIAVGRP